MGSSSFLSCTVIVYINCVSPFRLGHSQNNGICPFSDFVGTMLIFNKCCAGLLIACLVLPPSMGGCNT